jgi:hypothetical protein
MIPTFQSLRNPEYPVLYFRYETKDKGTSSAVLLSWNHQPCGPGRTATQVQ